MHCSSELISQQSTLGSLQQSATPTARDAMLSSGLSGHPLTRAIHTNFNLKNIEPPHTLYPVCPTLLSIVQYHIQEIDINVSHQFVSDNQFAYVYMCSSAAFHHIFICVCSTTV